MNSIQDFLAHLRDLDIKLWLDGDKLRVNAPKGVLTPLLSETISNRKKDIVGALTANNVSKQSIYPTIPRIENRTNLPLSFAQQRLFFIGCLVPESPLYNIPFVKRIIGDLNVDALHYGINEIIRRHEVLRTYFKISNGMPIQVIQPTLDINIQIDSVEECSDSELENEVQRLVDQEAQKPFDLHKGPLIRAYLLSVKKREHVFVMTMHHIISDGWSMGIIMQELSILYKAFIKGNRSPLSELPIQYADFTIWQQEWLQGEIIDRHLAFWKQQLADLSVLQLPMDFSRPVQQTYQGATCHFTISTQVTKALKSLLRQQRCTPFMALLTVFFVLLYRYTGQEDIAIGSPVAGRNQAELDNLIGFFVNTLVLRADLSGKPTFIELLERVRNITLDAHDHQELPFEKLVAELQIEQDISRNPLFQVMFVFQNPAEDDLQIENLDITSFRVSGRTSKFDLTMFFRDSGTELSGSVEYNTDLFAESSMKRLVDHLTTLLGGIAIKPDFPVSQLQLITEQERYQLLEEWNNTQIQYPSDRCIQQIFDNQVRISPKKVAVIEGNDRLTYEELHRKSNQLANYLRTLNVGPETLVGLYMERSIEMVIGILGILKAGGAYVPLDPSYPQERLTYMLEDCRTSVILTHKKLKGLQPATSSRIIYVDEEEVLTWKNEETPSCDTTPDNLAYVMYTSGSTGKPKGVCIPHRGVVRLVCGQKYISFDANKRFLLLAPISFDASTLELWGALLHGASVTVYSERYPSIPLLGELIQQYSITTLWLTSSLFNVIVDQAPDILAPLKELLTGGEALSPKHVHLVRQNLPHIRLINGYGPTESTTFTCCHPILNVSNPAAVSIPIGKPIANTQVFILDNHLQPVPVGVPGELHIGGDGLARGYLNRPELTASTFISSPFSTGTDARLYKTGDLARYLPNGNIEFIGRMDNQIKLRGFRIELSEIESVLSSHDAITSSLVTVYKAGSEDMRLVAYYTANYMLSNSASILRDYLSEKLPAYMVPQHFIEVESFPLTSNGKIDRARLPEPESLEATADEKFVGPKNDIEERMVVLWQELLGTIRVSTLDNFFHIGGHSLLAVQLFSRISKEFSLNLPLATLFKAPTIEKLSDIIITLNKAGKKSKTKRKRDFQSMNTWKHLVPIQPHGTRPPLFLMHAVGGNVLQYNVFASVLGDDQPLYGLQSLGISGLEKPHKSIEAMAASYIGEIREIQSSGPYYLGGGSMGGSIALEVAQQLKLLGEETALLVMFDTAGPAIMEDFAEELNDSFLRHLATRHVPVIRSMPARKKASYVFHKAASRLTRTSKMALCNVFLTVKYPIPHKLRYYYIEQKNKLPAYNYIPKPFDGRLTLFSASTGDEDGELSKSWESIFSNRIDIIEINAKHHEFIEHYSVPIELKKCLQQAQSAQQSSMLMCKNASNE